MFTGHWCLSYTLQKRANNTSAEEYNGTERILFLLVTVGRTVVICPLGMTLCTSATVESQTLQILHRDIGDDIYFCFTVGGLTAPLPRSSFLLILFLILYQSDQSKTIACKTCWLDNKACH